MLFNSYTFLFLFLPLCLAGFALASRLGARGALAWLVFASLLFYGWWEPAYLLLLAGSVAFNFSCACLLARMRLQSSLRARFLLVIAVVANVALLCHFKYLDFLLGVINEFAGTGFALPHLVLPLAISFYTLLQIAFLCDIHDGKVADLDLGNYVLFVTFFPHMIAGPIIHHSEMMPQFRALAGKRMDPRLLARGLFVFSLGLFKKVCIADSLARASDAGFAGATGLDFAGGWATALGYSLQLYFDFSGYSDMAIGLALMFGINFPYNFNSPYRASDIREFWHRWHMTLSRFLRDYVYIPLGGNQGGTLRMWRNLFLTFLIGGVWHGAGWPFVLWGVMHGLAVVMHRAWATTGLILPVWVAWPLTFLFVVVAFVMFRAPDVATALSVYAAMLDVGSFDMASMRAWRIEAGGAAFLGWLNALDVVGAGLGGWIFLAGCLLLCLLARNSNELGARFVVTGRWALATVAFLLCSVLAMQAERPFIYFQF